MLGVNCRSSSSSSSSSACPFLPQPSICENGFHQKFLNGLPKLSSHSNPPVWTLPHQSSLCLESEEATGFHSIVSMPAHGATSLKSSVELMKEIAKLEVVIMHLEQYLLSLYRIAFEERLHALTSITRAHLKYKTGMTSSVVPSKTCNRWEPKMQKGCFFSFDQAWPAHAFSISYDANSTSSFIGDSTRDNKLGGSGHRSLADHFDASCTDSDLNTSHRLSEDIIRCISSIYCKLASTVHSAGLSNSPTSSLSSSSIFSSTDPYESWSPHALEDVSVHHQGFEEEKGPLTAVVEVLTICFNDESYGYAAAKLQNFRLLVKDLEKADPRKMKREEKLAFWINIHNALVMHAYLAYGTRNRVKSRSLLKAAYNVGGHCVDAYVIQSSILGINPHYSAPWLQALFSPRRVLKTRNDKHVYALEYPEPLVHFALCSGAYSDPVVRVYSGKNVFRDLRLAKAEFIQANVHIHKESKIFMPKIVYYYAKDMSVDSPELLELVTGGLSEVKRKAIRKCIIVGKHGKYINWLPQSSTFRYVFHRDLAKGR